MGLITPYTLTVTAHSSDNSEARLRRPVNTVSIPVFQFGIFSETDLSFFPGPSFNFGGRVHSNGNLFLASGNTLTLSDRVTAVGEVVRDDLSNAWDTDNGYNGNVRAITAPGLFRDLAKTEGSVQVHAGLCTRTSRRGQPCRSAPTTATSATAAPAPSAWICRSSPWAPARSI